MRDRLVQSARELGLEVQVRRLEASTRTVREAAVAVGCEEAAIAKSIVFVADGDPVVCVASGRHRIDTDKLADALDVAEVRQAAADEVRAATGFAIGGVPPFGHDLPVLFDESLLEHERGCGRRRATPTACSASTRKSWPAAFVRGSSRSANRPFRQLYKPPP